MKDQTIRRAMPLLIFGLSLLNPVFADDPAEDKRYRCQVTTVNDRQGFIGVRADSLDEARAMAGRAQEATTRLDTREAVKEVVQCVEWPDGKFTDAGFQVWVDEVMPR